MYLPPPVMRRVAAPGGPHVTRYPPLPVRHLCATLLLASFSGVALWATMHRYPSSSPTVYTVAALADDLASNHTAWIGRTVWVRGEAVVQLNRPNSVAGVQFMQMYLVDPVRPRDILFMDGSPNPVHAPLVAAGRPTGAITTSAAHGPARGLPGPTPANPLCRGARLRRSRAAGWRSLVRRSMIVRHVGPAGRRQIRVGGRLSG